MSACGFLKNLATSPEHREAVRSSAAIPKLIVTAERNKSSSDVQNQAGLALYYIIGGEEPEAEWRQALPYET